MEICVSQARKHAALVAQADLLTGFPYRLVSQSRCFSMMISSCLWHIVTHRPIQARGQFPE